MLWGCLVLVNEDAESLYNLLYYCQEGQRVAVVGSRSDDDPIRNSLYIEQEEDEDVQEFLSADKEDGRLLIITGSAGDGKSALLERATRLSPDNAIPDKRVNMDATSARAADEDYDSRLYEFLDRVQPDIEAQRGKRSALAINYGLAIDFFRSRGNEADFPNIWGALRQSQTEGYAPDFQNIDVINLSHRHNYVTHPDQLGDGLVRDILDRVDPTHAESPFTEAFKTEQKECPAGDNCPLHYNMSQLSDEHVKDQLAEVFAAASVIRGSYLNPRMILDRIARTLLPTTIREVEAHDTCPVGAAVDRGDLAVTVDDLLWNSVFDTLRTNERQTSFVDPASRTDFTTDQEILYWSASSEELTPELAELEFKDTGPRQKIKTKLRKRYLSSTEGSVGSFISGDPSFREYLAALTYCRSERSQIDIDSISQIIMEFESRIEAALDNWTGQQNSGSLVEFRDAHRSTDYQFLSEWSSPSLLLEETKKATRELSTPGRVRLVIDPGKKDTEQISLPLSFGLYQLMTRVSEGYTPNSTDMSRSHAIQMLQSRMSDLTEKRSFVRIQNKAADRHVELKSGNLGIVVDSEGFQ